MIEALRVLALFAEGNPSTVSDPLSGGAGWFGAGLLGLVLAWLLLRHLPAKDAQIEKLIKDKDTHVQAIVTAVGTQLSDLADRYGEQQKTSRDEYKQALQAVINHCEKESINFATAMSRELQGIDKTVTSLISVVDLLRRRLIEGEKGGG